MSRLTRDALEELTELAEVQEPAELESGIQRTSSLRPWLEAALDAVGETELPLSVGAARKSDVVAAENGRGIVDEDEDAHGDGHEHEHADDRREP